MHKKHQIEARKWLLEVVREKNINVILTLAWMYEFGIEEI